ncbi:hypothetical protein DBR11_15305 [Pedobacter sp. HMWF019]|uniref:hypothetical protein n=1 Tax=Pedobacter sp. HMWF019 TaxID=2056856 RepID=UPI000D35203C|nr:hypothetical protein [Pedobacter sp. HMWF019]PTS98271.1 hypothetical protein DBR11_15305 [Pedobacter sp. HMWF019]
MKSKDQNNKSKTPDNKDYNPNKPQDNTQPQFNSTTDRRTSNELPQIENLNQENDKKNLINASEKGSSSPSTPENDDSLHGKK